VNGEILFMKKRKVLDSSFTPKDPLQKNSTIDPSAGDPFDLEESGKLVFS